MTDKKKDFINAWTTAAKDLGLVINPSFNILSDKGQTIHCTLLLENFGSTLGTAIFTGILQSPDPIFSSKVIMFQYSEMSTQNIIVTYLLTL